MSEQTTGLRFDIFERIALSKEIEGIVQLEEIELTPQIQLFTDDEQIVLKGHLLLSGEYVGEDSQGGHQLAQHIPVEITLPKSRVDNLDHLHVEIENFDVDVLSVRQLSVIGVISLQGVSSSDNRAEELSLDDETDKQPVVELPNEVEDTPRNHLNVVGERDDTVVLSQNDEGTAEVIEIDESIVGFESMESTESIESDIQAGPKEIKIAFESQRPKESGTSEDDLTSAMITGSQTETHTKSHEDKTGVDQDVRQDSENDDQEQENPATQWKNLLLHREGQEERQFSKMRLCIVQKEETLDTIAEKYSLNPREIILFNRLNDQEIAEGQVIYIPS